MGAHVGRPSGRLEKETQLCMVPIKPDLPLQWLAFHMVFVRILAGHSTALNGATVIVLPYSGHLEKLARLVVLRHK